MTARRQGAGTPGDVGERRLPGVLDGWADRGPVALVLQGAGVVTALGLVAALLAALSGCAPANPAPTASQPSLSPSSFDTFDATMWGDLTFDEVGDRLWERSEELVAACMHAEGWEYFPLSATDANLSTSSGFTLRTLEEARTHGYGLVSSPDSTTVDEVDPPADPQPDPYAHYLETLDDQARDLYMRDLLGAGDGSDEATATDPGCFRAGMTDANPLLALSTDPRWAVLSEEMDAVTASAEAEPAARAADADWSACMTTAGYPGFPRPENARETLQAEIDATYGSSGYVSSEVRDTFQTEREIPTAVQDVTCRLATDHESRRRAVVDRAQQNYLDAHAAELETYVLAWAEALETITS